MASKSLPSSRRAGPRGFPRCAHHRSPGTQGTFVRAGLLAAPPPRAPPRAGAPARAAAGTPGASFLQPQAGDWRASSGTAGRPRGSAKILGRRPNRALGSGRVGRGALEFKPSQRLGREEPEGQARRPAPGAGGAGRPGCGSGDLAPPPPGRRRAGPRYLGVAGRSRPRPGPPRPGRPDLPSSSAEAPGAPAARPGGRAPAPARRLAEPRPLARRRLCVPGAGRTTDTTSVLFSRSSSLFQSHPGVQRATCPWSPEKTTCLFKNGRVPRRPAAAPPSPLPLSAPPPEMAPGPRPQPGHDRETGVPVGARPPSTGRRSVCG